MSRDKLALLLDSACRMSVLNVSGSNKKQTFPAIFWLLVLPFSLYLFCGFDRLPKHCRRLTTTWPCVTDHVCLCVSDISTRGITEVLFFPLFIGNTQNLQLWNRHHKSGRFEVVTDSGVIYNIYNTSPAHSHVLSSFALWEIWNIASHKPPSPICWQYELNSG